MLIPQPQPVVHLIALTLEEIHALGILLDRMPDQDKELQDELEGIFDKIDPILCETYGNYWDEQ